MTPWELGQLSEVALTPEQLRVMAERINAHVAERLEAAMLEVGAGVDGEEVDCRLELGTHAAEWAPAIAKALARVGLRNG